MHAQALDRMGAQYHAENKSTPPHTHTPTQPRPRSPAHTLHPRSLLSLRAPLRDAGPGHSPAVLPAASTARPTPQPPARHLRGRRSPPSAAPGTPPPRSRPWGARKSSGCTGVRPGPPCRSLDFQASPPTPGCRKEAREGAGPSSRLEETSWGRGGAEPGAGRGRGGGRWRGRHLAAPGGFR